MGSSKYITKQRAAAILDVSDRTVTRYMKKGLLRFEYQKTGTGRSPYVVEEDVLRLQKGRKDLLATPLNRDILTALRMEIQTLKSQMAAVLKVLNLQHDELRFTPMEYKNAYEAADQYSVDGWPPHIEEPWADTFLRMRVEDLEKMVPVTNDAHPWKPFLRLATSMKLRPWNTKLRDVLAAGENNLRQMAGIWCVLKGDSPKTLDLLTERDAAPLNKLLRRMGKVQNS